MSGEKKAKALLDKASEALEAANEAVTQKEQALKDAQDKAAETSLAQ